MAFHHSNHEFRHEAFNGHVWQCGVFFGHTVPLLPSIGASSSFIFDLVILKFEKNWVRQDIPLLFISEVVRLMCVNNSAVVKLLKLFPH